MPTGKKPREEIIKDSRDILVHRLMDRVGSLARQRAEPAIHVPLYSKRGRGG
jgi:hypothetical protein